MGTIPSSTTSATPAISLPEATWLFSAGREDAPAGVPCSHYSQSVRVLTTGTDLGKLERLNAMARRICQDKPSVAEIGAMVSGEQRIGYSPWLELAGYITMTFGFAIFFGGDLLDGLASALVSVVIFCTNRLLNHRIQANQNRLFYTCLLYTSRCV